MSRTKKIVLSLVVVITILAVSGIVLRLKLEPLVHDFLIDAVATSTNERYSLEMSDLKIHLLKGGFSMADVKLTSDSTLISIGSIEIRRIQIIRFWREKSLAIGSVIIETPTIDLVPTKIKKTNETDSDSGTLADRIYEAVKPVLEAIEIDEIDIRDAGITIRNRVGGYEIFNAHDVDVRIRDVAIDSTRRPIDDIRVGIASVAWNLANNLYRIQSRSISISTEDKTMSVAGFKLVPLGDFETFSMTLGQRNRNEFEFDRIDITDWDSDTYFHDGKLLAGRMSILNPSLLTAHDKRLPPREPQFRKLMHLMLFDIPFPLILETVTISNGSIHYRHRHEDHPTPGLLRFEQLEATLTHVGNLGAPDMTLHVETIAMGEGHLTVDVDFHMSDPLGTHRLHGLFVKTSFAAFNPVLENIVLLGAKSGYLNRMEFQMDLDNDRSFGYVTMDYRDVEIRLLGDGQRFRTFLANRFVINKTHTGDDSKPESISFTRVQDKNIFHYWWMSLFSGLGKTLGLM